MNVLTLLGFVAVVAAGDWHLGPAADADSPMRLTFAVKQTNVQWLEEKLLKVSDPKSCEYGE